MRRVDKGLARLMGFLYGDGWAYHNISGGYYEVGFQQSVRNASIYEYYKSLAMRYFHNVYARERMRQGKRELMLYGKELFAIVSSVKANPIGFLSSLDESGKIAFIAGFTDADGYIGCDEAAIYDVSRELLDKLCGLLKSLNIKCRVTRNKSIWRLRIRSRESINRFIMLVSPVREHLSLASSRSNPVGEAAEASAGNQSTTAWFCRGKLGGTNFQG